MCIAIEEGAHRFTTGAGDTPHMSRLASFPCRPFPPPAFDRILYAIKNWRQERPGNEAMSRLGKLLNYESWRAPPLTTSGIRQRTYLFPDVKGNNKLDGEQRVSASSKCFRVRGGLVRLVFLYKYNDAR